MNPMRLRASVTVFVALVFGCVILLFLVLFFLAEKNYAETAGCQLIEVSASAVMGEFDRSIEEKFGFYSIKSSAKVQRGFLYFLEGNTKVSGPVFMDKLAVENVQTLTVEQLGDIDTLKKQISEFMEIRGLVESTALLIQQFSDAEEGAKQAQEELQNYNGLEAYNSAYLKVVEILEGVRSDGSQRNDGVRHYETTVLPKGKTPSFKSLSFQIALQKLYERNEELKYALRTLRQTEATIEGDQKELLPLNAAQIKTLENRRTSNAVLLNKMLLALEMTEEEQKSAYLNLKNLYREIHIEYEIKEKASYSLTQLKKAIFGEAANLKIYAPNKDAVDRDSELYLNLPSHQTSSLAEDPTDLEVYSEAIVESLDVKVDEVLFRAQLMLYISGMLTNLQDTIRENNGEEVVNMRQREYVKGYFNNEEEYLFMGSVNEYQNIQGVKAGVLTLRTVLNMATLLCDSDKMNLIKTLASSTGGCVVPGIGEKVIEVLLVTAWSLWEASADWTALVNGKKISLIKACEEWQTDLDSILGALMGKGSVPDSEEAEGAKNITALNYSGYLMLLMNVIPNEVLLKRLQDLMYLQLSGQDLNEMVCGFVSKGSFRCAGLTFNFERAFSY